MTKPDKTKPDTDRPALQAAGRLVVLADLEQRDERDRVWTTLDDAVQPDQVRVGAKVLAGRGECVWQARVTAVFREDGRTVVLLTPLGPPPGRHSGLALRRLLAAARAELDGAREVPPPACKQLTPEQLRLVIDEINSLCTELEQALDAVAAIREIARVAVYRVVAEALLASPEQAFTSPQWLELLIAARVPQRRGTGRVARAVLARDLAAQSGLAGGPTGDGSAPLVSGRGRRRRAAPGDGQSRARPGPA